MNKKQAILSLSGGMDSSTLLIHLLANEYEVTCLSFDYGQKHSVELERAKELVSYINAQTHQPGLIYPKIKHHIIKLDGLSNLLNSTLVNGGEDVPEGHYAEETMKQTVVPNRNKIFSSIIQAAALSKAQQNNTECVIAMGIHAGDHCFSRDTNILTPQGNKTVDYLKIGDEIYSYNLEKNKWEVDIVTDIIKKNIVSNINKIYTYAGDIKLTSEHNVYRLKLGNFNSHSGYDKTIEKVKVSDLKEGDYLVQPSGICGKNNHIETIDLLKIVTPLLEKYEKGLVLREEEGFIWLGGDSDKYKSRKVPRFIQAKPFINVMAWYIAEGWSQQNPYTVTRTSSRYSAQFCQSLKANLEKVDLIIKTLSEGEIPVKYEFSKNTHNNIPKEMTVYISNIMSVFLKECGHNSQTKHIPQWLMDILLTSNELREEFLYTLGISDGFNTDTLYRGFCSTSKKLIEQVISLIQLSGYHFSLPVSKTKTQYINYSKLGQKQALISLGEGKFTKILKLEQIPYNDYVFDISVEKNHNFVAGSFASILISNSIYPDCRQEFRDADFEAFKLGNWDSHLVSYYTPYLYTDKLGILQDGLVCCASLGLDFDEVYSRTNTSYKPIWIPTQKMSGMSGSWYSDYKSASSVERILAFVALGIPDPVEYADENGPVTWEFVMNHALKVEENYKNNKK